jgi:transglutaminase-like putative cysteine protease
VSRVLSDRRGVCQDFAHLQIACLRSLGLAARYVSGYLLTDPPPGLPRLIGADASHAWVSVFCPVSGWVDLDPTNGVRVADRHVTLAWGRDYSDVTPLRGVLLGGNEHQLFVGVSVVPADEEPAPA